MAAAKKPVRVDVGVKPTAKVSDMNFNNISNRKCSTCASYVNQASEWLSSPGLGWPASQGQAAIKEASGLSMKTGRAQLQQIFTNG